MLNPDLPSLYPLNYDIFGNLNFKMCKINNFEDLFF